MSDSEVAETQPNSSAGRATQQATVTVINRYLNITPFQVTRETTPEIIEGEIEENKVLVDENRISNVNSDSSASKTHN